MAGRCVVAGASRGIGAAVARHLAEWGWDVLGVARGPSAAGRSLRADLAAPEGIAAVAAAVGADPLDALLHMGGTWEAGAFTDAYRFEGSADAETRGVIAVNLVAPVSLAQALAPALRRAANGRVVLMGSLDGLPGRAGREVANSASKAGLVGAAAALRLSLPGVGVTVVNPGNVATAEVEADIREGRFAPQAPIPLADLLAVIDCVLALSPLSTVEAVDLAQRRPALPPAPPLG